MIIGNKTWFSPKRYRYSDLNSESYYIEVDGKPNGVFHRKNGPAFILKDDCIQWAKHGDCNRIDGPCYYISSSESYYNLLPVRDGWQTEEEYWNT